MSFDDEDESFEHTLLVVREVAVYKIPPRSTSGGYKCGEWLQSDKIWTGRLRVVSCKDRCEIRLEDPNSGELFAACFVNPGQRETSVETVLDSSRYFVLKIEDGETIRINVKPKPTSGTGMLSAAGLAGPGKPKAAVGLAPPPGTGKIRSPLPPPPNDPVVARLASPGTASAAQGLGFKATKENTRRDSDSLSDLSPLERNLPSATSSGSAKTTAAGWAAF
ncbi:hypothetical protein F8388_009457 [Cannabis sativa]|uniref:NECAP PHear domain-containing protein n=1 Tax=Cannabis sativa TaxID=3483 RepID=A0A7J6EIJ8_CANSA|nr:hypothetical protein F8388_009457 [Cannabis sativa]KAF4387101.1 hypothetical protein G4B88_024673 [Cannabis sativa]